MTSGTRKKAGDRRAHLRSKCTEEKLRAKIFAWIEMEYNRDRLYSANDEHMPPLIKRALFFETDCCIDRAA